MDMMALFFSVVFFGGILLCAVVFRKRRRSLEKEHRYRASDFTIIDTTPKEP